MVWSGGAHWSRACRVPMSHSVDVFHEPDFPDVEPVSMLCCGPNCWTSDVLNLFDPEKWLSIFHTCGLLPSSSFFNWKTTSWHFFFFGDSRSVLYHYTDFVTNTTDFIFGAFFIFLLENSDSVLHLKQGTSSGFSFWFLNLKLLVTYWFLLSVHLLPDRKCQLGAIPFSSLVSWQTFRMNGFTSTRATALTRMEWLSRFSLIAPL